MDYLQWSKAEKQVARRAFDAAYEKECRAIRAKLTQMLEAEDDIRQIWRIHDYLSDQRRETDRKYDYRYSVLDLVFARLIREGWITEADLTGLREDKLQRIKFVASL
jgi:hypothetical protein